MVFAGSEFLWNATPANLEKNLYISFFHDSDVEVVHLNAFEGVDDGANGVADDEDDDDEHEHHRDGVIATLV